MSENRRHILGLSGGKDSSALAIYMRDKVPEMMYTVRRKFGCSNDQQKYPCSLFSWYISSAGATRLGCKTIDCLSHLVSKLEE